MKEKPSMRRIARTALTLAIMLFTAVASRGATASEESLMRVYDAVKDYGTERLLSRAEEYIKAGEINNAQVCLHVIAGRYSPSMPQQEKDLAARAFNKNAYIYLLKQNYIRAYSSLLKSLSCDNRLEAPTSWLYLSIICYYYKDNVQERRYLRKAYDTVRRTGNTQQTQLIFLNFANGYYAADSLAAIRRDLIGYSSLPRLDTPLGRYVALTVKGYLASLEGHHRQAIAIFTQATHSVEGQKDEERCLANGFYNISHEHMLMGNAQQAVANMEKCRAIAQSYGYGEIETDCYRLLADYYRAAGDSAAYIKSKLKYVEMKDSIFSESTFGCIKDMQSTYEKEEIENSVTELTLQRRLYIALLTMAAAVAALTVVFAIVLWSRNRKLKAANDMLFERYRQMTHTDNPQPCTTVGDTTSDGDAPTDQTEVSDTAANDEAETKARALGEEVAKFFDTSDRWCQPDFSLAELARLLDSNTSYVSTAINMTFGKNFRSALNERRVRRASQMLADFTSYGNITIEAIAHDCGFKTASHFSSTFKQITGLSPAVFREIARKK